MINPEFRRNLWLELSPQRLVLMPTVLGVIAALAFFLSQDSNPAKVLLAVFATLGFLLVGAWGSFTALASINSEVAEHTWDQQRLSALSPWQMAWGKLLGANIYPWFGGLICAAVVLISGLVEGSNPARVMRLLLSGIVGCLALHCWIMASRLHTMDVHAAGNNSALIKRLFGIYVLLQILPGVFFLLIGQYFGDHASATGWWGLQLSFSSLCLLMACLMLALGLLALWRTMSAQLMVRTTPWAWTLGCTATGLIVAGFANGPQTRFLWPALVASVAWVATYFALFTEKNNGMVWRAVVFYVQQGSWKRMLQTLPLWPVSWLLAVLFALLYTLFTRLSAHSVASERILALHISAYQVLWMLVLHALRDAGIYLFFAWRNTQRKPLGMALLTYVMLGGILPTFFKQGNNSLAWIFEPLHGMQISHFAKNFETGASLIHPLAWLAMMAHLAIVGALLTWRWKQSVQLPPESLAKH